MQEERCVYFNSKGGCCPANADAVALLVSFTLRLAKAAASKFASMGRDIQDSHYLIVSTCATSSWRYNAVKHDAFVASAVHCGRLAAGSRGLTAQPARWRQWLNGFDFRHHHGSWMTDCSRAAGSARCNENRGICQDDLQ